MKKKTFCTLTNSGTWSVQVKDHATRTLASRMTTPANWPKRTCCVSLDSGRNSFL